MKRTKKILLVILLIVLVWGLMFTMNIIFTKSIHTYKVGESFIGTVGIIKVVEPTWENADWNKWGNG
jgi:uncharacterized membrane protein HdeD (DUF308 family)